MCDTVCIEDKTSSNSKCVDRLLTYFDQEGLEVWALSADEVVNELYYSLGIRRRGGGVIRAPQRKRFPISI